MKKHPPTTATTRARELRRSPTAAELRMWQLLRECYPDARFRRQVPILQFITDFASHRIKIVIEIDGGQHSPAKDAPRSQAIEAEGYRILRFWNNEVLDNGDGCMITLGLALGQAHPHPTPARTRFRGSKPAYPSPIKGEEAS